MSKYKVNDVLISINDVLYSKFDINTPVVRVKVLKIIKVQYQLEFLNSGMIDVFDIDYVNRFFKLSLKSKLKNL